MVSYAPPETLKRRADFLRLASRGRRFARPGFVLQALRCAPDAPLRVGYTATRKIGNAVLRNRARRRLREALRLVLGQAPVSGFELVLICRRETAALPFAILQGELHAAIAEATR